MKIETPLIAILLASTIFGGMFAVFMGLGIDNGANTDLSAHTSQNGETSFEDAFDRVNESKTDMEGIVTDFEDNTDLNSAGDIFPFLQLVFKSGKQMFNSVTIIKDVLFIMSDLIGLPPIVVGTLISILMIVLLVSVLMILAGRSYQ